jgi:hypothetical protein
VKSYWVPPP